MANDLTIYQAVIDDVKGIIASGLESAYKATNRAMVLTYWNVGRRIVEQEQNGNRRAEYGTAMMDALAAELTREYGNSYSKRNLQYFRKFYQYFPDLEIVNTRVHNLSWSHFRCLLRVPDEDASYLESDLESAILSHIRDFLMEMGRGFAFVARQQHIITDTQDYYIDLVLYNIELKCYVLIDLKMGKITHQDVGQMDMYVRMYNELKCTAGDNPTMSILLCSETDEDIARYSVLHDNEHLFMSKYLTYLPTKEQLRTEIERQKEIFYMQHPMLPKEGGDTK